MLKTDYDIPIFKDEDVADLNEYSNEMASALKTQLDKFGNPLVYKGEVATLEDLPSEAESGNIYSVTSENKNYIYNGTIWVEYSSTLDLTYLENNTKEVSEELKEVTENKRLTLEGKSEQETSTQGKNYFTGNKIASESNLGITYNFDNSILKLNGTVTAGGSIIEDKPTKVKLPAGTYTYFIKVKSGTYEGPSGDFALYIKSDPNTFITGNYVTSGITGSDLKNGSGASSRVITITEEKEIFVRFFASNKDIKFNNLELEIQIEKGNSFTGFEQFVHNSPTPDYPSRIRNVGDNINSFDKDNAKLSNAYFDSKTGAIINGGASTITTTYTKIVANQNFVLTCKKLGRVVFYDDDKNIIKVTTTSSPFVFNENASYIRIQYETAGSDINSIKLEQGSIASPYTPYGCGSIDYKVENADKTESKNIHFPLSKGQVIHEGDYVDSIGIHQKRKTLVLTGNETITRRGYIDSTNKTYRYSIKLEGRDLNSRTNLICSHLPTNENYGNNKSLIFGGGLNEGNIAYLQFVLDEIGMTDVTKINEYFKTQYANGTPVTVEYELAEEIVTPLTNKQTEEFYELQKAKYVDEMTLTCMNEVVPTLADIDKKLKENLLEIEENITKVEKKLKKEKSESGVIVSATEPREDNRRKIWLQKGRRLFNYKTANYLLAYSNITAMQITISLSSDNHRSSYVKCKPNTTYTIEKKAGHSFRVSTTTDEPAAGVTINKSVANHEGSTINITTGENDNYIFFTCFSSVNGDTGDYLDMYKTVKVEEGKSITPNKIYILNDDNEYEEFVTD